MTGADLFRYGVYAVAGAAAVPAIVAIGLPLVGGAAVLSALGVGGLSLTSLGGAVVGVAAAAHAENTAVAKAP